MVAWCRRRRAGNSGIVQALFNRQGVAIAGRDGTLVQSGGTGSTALHPTYGSVQSSGALISHNLAIPGVGVLPMSFAQGARTNLLRYSESFDNAAWSATACTEASDGVAPWGATASRFIPDNLTAPQGSAEAQSVSKAASSITYTLSLYIKSGGFTSVRVQVDAGTSANSSRFVVDAVTGSVSAVTNIGTFSGVAPTTDALVNGWHKLTFTVTTGTEAAVRVIYLSGDTGDGVNGYYITGTQLEQASSPGVYIPTTSAALTRAADNILWTPPSALSTTSGEVVAIAAPYLWSAGVGVAHPGTTGRKVHNANASIHRTTSDVAVKADGGTQTASVSALADTTGVLRLVSQKWDGNALSLYQGSTLAASDSTLSAPWGAVSTLVMGGTATPSENWFGFVGAIYVPGGLTDAERIALASVTGGSLTYVG